MHKTNLVLEAQHKTRRSSDEIYMLEIPTQQSEQSVLGYNFFLPNGSFLFLKQIHSNVRKEWNSIWQA